MQDTTQRRRLKDLALSIRGKSATAVKESSPMDLADDLRCYDERSRLF